MPRAWTALRARLDAAPPPRYLLPWLRSLRSSAGALAVGLPWLTFGAIAWLEAHLSSGSLCFEWGSGGSTLFLAARGARVVTVEHDASWLERVRAALPAAHRARVELLLCPPGRASPELRTEAEDAFAPVAEGERHRGQSFEAYAGAIDGQAASSLDLVLVDGAARGACVLRALPKLRPGGHLMLDDSGWRGYAPILARLDAVASTRADFAGMGPGNRHGLRLFSKRTSVWTM